MQDRTAVFRIKALEEAIKGDDKAVIEDRSKVLSEASAKMAERAYAQSGPDTGGASAGAGASAGNDDVVDAEFEDVSKGR